MRIAKNLAMVFAFVCLPLVAQQQAPTPAYKNPRLSIQDRVADLLSRMTLEEKVSEIAGGRHAERGLLDSTGQLRFKTTEELFRELYRNDNKMTARGKSGTDGTFSIFF